MPNVEFEDSGQTQSLSPIKIEEMKTPTAIRLLKKYHIVKTNDQGYWVLLGITALCIMLTIGVIYFFILPPKQGKLILNPNLTPEEQMQVQQMFKSNSK